MSRTSGGSHRRPGPAPVRYDDHVVRILVTGAAGFIGSQYVRTALTGGYPEVAGAAVTVVDSLALTGDFAALSAVAGHPDLTLVRGDVCDARLVDEVAAGQ